MLARKRGVCQYRRPVAGQQRFHDLMARGTEMIEIGTRLLGPQIERETPWEDLLPQQIIVGGGVHILRLGRPLLRGAAGLQAARQDPRNTAFQSDRVGEGRLVDSPQFAPRPDRDDGVLRQVRREPRPQAATLR